MADMASNANQTGDALHGLKLKKLTAELIRQIDEMLSSMEGSGQVRLVVQRGELRYVNKVEVHPASESDAHEDDE